MTGAAAILAIAALLPGDGFLPEATARLAMTPATVKPGAPTHFQHGDEVAGCPSPAARCQRAGYLRGGDVVLIGRARGGFVLASYTNGTRMTEGWLPRTSLVALPHSTPMLATWRGEWTRDDEASINVTASRRAGALRFEGTAMYGTRDPARVARGAINTGNLGDDAAPTGDRVAFGSPAAYECGVQMRLAGPYLIVADNFGCGGVNVTFSGVYRRTPKRRTQETS